MSKQKKLVLSYDDDEPLKVGLVRLKTPLEATRFFFELNKLNSTHPFYRVENLNLTMENATYEFLQMECKDQNGIEVFKILANKSFKIKEKIPNTLFKVAQKIAFLLPNEKDVDYLIIPKNEFVDFSLILFPKFRIFSFQEYFIESEEFIYQYIQ